MEDKNNEIVDEIIGIDIYVKTNKGKRKIKLYDFVNMKEPTLSFITDDNKSTRCEISLNIKCNDYKMKIE